MRTPSFIVYSVWLFVTIDTGARAVSLQQTGTGPTPHQDLHIKVTPKQPLIEHRGEMQILNFDFILKNDGTVAQHLNRVEVSVYDHSSSLVLRRSLDENGDPSGMTTVPKRDVAAKQEISIFNPFFVFDHEVPIDHLNYVFYFNASGAEMASPLDYQTSLGVAVTAADYTDHAQLELPVRVRSIIFDGHDFYAHHRRLDLAEPSGGSNLVHSNPLRYADDFCPVDAEGAMYHDGMYNKKHWYGYGTPIYAPAEGLVTEAVNDVPENEYRGREVVHPAIKDTASAVFGNHVVLDHGQGEVSFFGHMQTGSLRVKKGDHVMRGQIIGQIGFTGDAFIPHLHYMLMNGPDFLHAEGVPSYFHDFRRILGEQTKTVRVGQIDSGDIVEGQVRKPE